MSAPRILPVLQLLRAGALFSPATDVVASVAVLGLPWNGAALRAVGASVCLYAAGMALNDLADRRRDALVRPERPLPRGDVTPAFACMLVFALLAGGLLLSPCRLWHGAIAVLVLAYDLALKRIDVLGAIGMAALRAMNLATALTLVAPELRDGPAAAALVTAALCYGAYIAAVTMLGSFEDRPDTGARAVAAALAAPPLAAVFGVFAVQGGLGLAPVLATLPALWFARRFTRLATFDQLTIRAGVTRLLVGTMLYAALLALAAGRWPEALVSALAVAPASWIARRIALT